MRYMGGKARVAKYIMQAILADTTRRDYWWEPFVGGGNMLEYAVPHFSMSVGTDAHEDLIHLWKHVSSGGALPDEISRDEYRKLRDSNPSWLRGAAGFGASFGGKWFGGYGTQRIAGNHREDNVWPQSRRSLIRQGDLFRKHSVKFECGGYDQFSPPPGCVIYCDPPYTGTTKYADSGSFDHEKFINQARIWALTCDVYLSEYESEEELVWEKERRVLLKSGENDKKSATERLYRVRARQ